jgi:hypothetical protein
MGRRNVKRHDRSPRTTDPAAIRSAFRRAHATDGSSLALFVSNKQERKSALRRKTSDEWEYETALQRACRPINDGEAVPKPDAIALRFI